MKISIPALLVFSYSIESVAVMNVITTKANRLKWRQQNPAKVSETLSITIIIDDKLGEMIFNYRIVLIHYNVNISSPLVEFWLTTVCEVKPHERRLDRRVRLQESSSAMKTLETQHEQEQHIAPIYDEVCGAWRRGRKKDLCSSYIHFYAAIMKHIRQVNVLHSFLDYFSSTFCSSKWK